MQQAQVTNWPVPPHVVEVLSVRNSGAPVNQSNQTRVKFTNPNTDNYDGNIKYSASLHLDEIKENSHKGQRAIVCGSGPSLNDPLVLASIKSEMEKPGTVIIACKAAIKALHEKGFKVAYGCTMDPGAHIACDAKISKVSGVTHLVASSSDPAVFDYLKDEKVVVFHSATGYKKEMFLYKKLFKNDWIASGGYNVLNRAISCATYMGFETIILAGADGGWRDDQDFYVSGKNDKDGLDMKDFGAVDGTNWNTRPDMLASAIALARLGKKMGPEKFIILGDVIPANLRYKCEKFLDRVGSFLKE